MTFQDYINQENPKRHYNGVIVEEKDCVSISDIGRGDRIAMLKIHDRYYTYLIPNGLLGFYLMDEDGNKKACSCFTFPIQMA